MKEMIAKLYFGFKSTVPHQPGHVSLLKEAKCYSGKERKYIVGRCGSKSLVIHVKMIGVVSCRPVAA